MTRRAVRASGLVAALVAAVLFLPAAPAPAQVSLSLSTSTVTLPTADPDSTPVIAAPPFTLRARANRSTWQLTVVASGDLNSGASTIPIGNLSWTITPNPPFRDGVMSRTVPQLMGSGTRLNPAVTATVIFYLVNSWTYDVANYSVTLTYTLSGV